MKIHIKKILLLPLCLLTLSRPTQGQELQLDHAVYLGIQNYGSVSQSQKDNFKHNFFLENQQTAYQISPINNYAIQNLLSEGYVYDLLLENNIITDASPSSPTAQGTIQHLTTSELTLNNTPYPLAEQYQTYSLSPQGGGTQLSPTQVQEGSTVQVYGNPITLILETFQAQAYTPPLSATPGQATLKNFLATALQPVGTTLYIYGGGWDWQDQGSSLQATSIGLSQTWIDFYQSQNTSFNYGYSITPSRSYYPHHNYNQYNFAGLDCSGYLGWTVYNTLHNTDGENGYVLSSTLQAKTLAQTHNLGTFTQSFSPTSFQVGDIFSMNGHVWICLGICDDGSLVILHSTPSPSITGSLGGGVQLSAVGSNSNCQATQLVNHYMSTYYPDWSSRYTPIFNSYSSYTSTSNTQGGKFSWHLSTQGLQDPDGYAQMSAEEILHDLFQTPIPEQNIESEPDLSWSQIQEHFQQNLQTNPLFQTFFPKLLTFSPARSLPLTLLLSSPFTAIP